MSGLTQQQARSELLMALVLADGVAEELSVVSRLRSEPVAAPNTIEHFETRARQQLDALRKRLDLVLNGTRSDSLQRHFQFEECRG